jgi:hypothetical protein
LSNSLNALIKCATVAAILVVAGAGAEETTIRSDLTVINSENPSQIVFDFPTVISPEDQIKAISVDWEVMLPVDATFPGVAPEGEELTLIGGLYVGDIELGTGFQTTLNTDGGIASTSITLTNVSDAAETALLEAFAGGDDIELEFKGSSDFEALFSAIAGNEQGSITAQITLDLEPSRGQNVPEPASIAVWGAALLGVGAVRRCRRAR